MGIKEIFVFCALGLLLGSFMFVWLMTRVRYRIGSRHLKVLLFNLPIRRVALSSVQSVSKRPGVGWSEHWWCTTRPKHRMLVLRRSRGLFRNFVITPKNRYIFKTELERALRRTGQPVSETSADLGEDPGPQENALAEQAPGNSSSPRSSNCPGA